MDIFGGFYSTSYRVGPRPHSRAVATPGLWREVQFRQVGTGSQTFATFPGFPDVTISLVLGNLVPS